MRNHVYVLGQRLSAAVDIHSDQKLQEADVVRRRGCLLGYGTERRPSHSPPPDLEQQSDSKHWTRGNMEYFSVRLCRDCLGRRRLVMSTIRLVVVES